MKLIKTIAILIISCAISFLLAVSTKYYSDFFINKFNVIDSTIKDLIFFSYFVLIGFLVTIWKPKVFGWQVGESFRYWKLITMVFLFTASSTTLYILISGPTPYHSGLRQLLPNLLLVPLGEETIFRGILFTVMLNLLNKIHSEETSIIIAIIFSAVAFGIAHANNLFYNPIPFTLFQIFYSTVFGLLFGYVRSKTNSLYPAILLHATMNIIGILL